MLRLHTLCIIDNAPFIEEAPFLASMLPDGGIEGAPFIEEAPFLASMLPDGGLASMLAFC
jgi:hypothetical protein